MWRLRLWLVQVLQLKVNFGSQDCKRGGREKMENTLVWTESLITWKDKQSSFTQLFFRVPEEYHSPDWTSICFLSEDTDDFGEGDEEGKGVLCINRVEETEGVPSPSLPDDWTSRVSLGGCDWRPSMEGNHLIRLHVLSTSLSILDRCGFKGAMRTTMNTPAELEAETWAGFTLQLYSSTSPISWCDTAVLNDRAPLLNGPLD